MNETFSLSMWRNPVNSVVSNLKFDSYNEYVKKVELDLEFPEKRVSSEK